MRLPRALLPLWVALWSIAASVRAWHVMIYGRENSALNSLAIVFGLLAAWDFAAIAARPLFAHAWVRTLAGMSFFIIYAAHEPLASLLRRALVAGVGYEHQLVYLAASAVIAAATFWLCALASLSLQRWTPGVYAILAGGRTAQPAGQPATARPPRDPLRPPSVALPRDLTHPS